MGGVLFAGPFVGEFGWELFGWQGYIREIAKQYDRVIICSRSDREYLYRDFYDEFIIHDPIKTNCAGWTCYGYKHGGKIHEKYNPDCHIFINSPKSGTEFIREKKQNFICYGEKIDKPIFDLAIHARMIKDRDSFANSRNWVSEKWEKLIRVLGEKNKIASIGSEVYSQHILGTIDCRGFNLKDVAKILRNCKMIIGPSSGPMHFATLCKCPQLLWTSRKIGIGMGNRKKYEEGWNPFGVKSRIYEKEDWDPSVNLILDEFKEFEKELGEKR